MGHAGHRAPNKNYVHKKLAQERDKLEWPSSSATQVRSLMSIPGLTGDEFLVDASDWRYESRVYDRLIEHVVDVEVELVSALTKTKE